MGVFRADLDGTIVLALATLQVIGVADVEPPVGVFENVGPEAFRCACQSPRLGLEPKT